jgi:hypothetical protein
MDALLVTGAKATHLQTVYTTHKSMNKKKTTLLVVDNVSDVMAEAVSILFFFSIINVDLFAAGQSRSFTDTVVQRVRCTIGCRNSGHGTTTHAEQLDGRS